MCEATQGAVIGQLFPPGETRAEFPPEPTHSCVRAASGGQGRPGSAARIAGCLDRRLIRRATLTCLRLRYRVSIPTGLPVHHLRSPVASSMAPEFFAPDLSEGATPRRVSRRVFNSPQPARTIGRVFDTPAEGTPSPDGACDRPALPADHPPPVEHRGPPAAARRPVPEQDRRADSARQGRACQSEGTAKEPPLCHFTQLGDSCVGKVAAGGRATRPTNPGRTCDVRQVLVASSRVQVRRTPVVPLDWHFSEDYRTARCSIARNSDRRLCMTTLLGRPS